MLYKPTSPSPYAECIAFDGTENDNIQFLCSMIGGEIGQSRLKLSNGNIQYYFDEDANTPIKPEITNDGYSSNIKYNAVMSNEHDYYTITSTQSPNRSGKLSTTLSNILVTNSDYTWQVRLYEKGSFDNNQYRSNIWLAYGVVGSGSKSTLYYTSNESYSNSSSSGGERRIAIAIRPHQNIFFENATGKHSNTNHLYNYYDDNARYYIKINNRFVRILDYKFYDPLDDFDPSSDLDKYGYPKKAYAIVAYDDTLSFNKGDTYEIYCNYIDSDEYYFSIIDSPSLTFKNQFGDSIGDNESIDYSNLTLNGFYSHSGGATVNYYNVILSWLNPQTQEYEVIDATSNIYSSVLSYSYNTFMNGEKYRLVYTIRDTNNYILSKEIYISVDYSIGSIPLRVNVDYYKPHDSNIIDFSEIISISAQQKSPESGYSLVAIDEEYGEENLDEENKNCCKISNGNQFTYNRIDGVGILAFENPTLYTELKIDTVKTGLIARTTDDNGVVCSLFWDGVYLIGEWIRSGRIDIKKISLYGAEKINNISDLAEALSLNSENYSVPYLWDDLLEWSDDYYWHEETAISGKWWRVILTPDNIYAKNVDNKKYSIGIAEEVI